LFVVTTTANPDRTAAATYHSLKATICLLIYLVYFKEPALRASLPAQLKSFFTFEEKHISVFF